jgi:hypothetical protein
MSAQDQFNSIALRVQDSLAGLGARDRKLLGVLVAIVGFSILGGLGYLMRSSLNNLESMVEYREDSLLQAQKMAVEYQANVETANLISTQLEEHRGANLSAYLEKSAQTVGISDRLDSVKETSASPIGDLEEKLYSAQLSKLSLEDATNFIFEIENSGFPLVIKNARFKTRKTGGEKKVKLTLDIASYQLTTEAPPPPTEPTKPTEPTEPTEPGVEG